MSSDFAQVSEWLHARQSIYPASFTGECISDAVILEILKNANQAPSHRNTEPWRFKVITTESLEAFADFAQSIYKQVKVDAAFNERKYKKTRNKILSSSHVLIITMERDAKGSVPEWEEIAATACAVQNIYLSLKPLGLGGYWSTPDYIIENIGQFVEMAAGERCLGLFYIGICSDGYPPQVMKRSIEEKINWY